MDIVVETADEVVSAGFPVYLIKQDIESYEYRVLCGMAQTLARPRPALIFERLPTTSPERLRSCCDIWDTVFMNSLLLER